MTPVRIADIADVVRGVSWDKSEASDMPREGYLPILRAGHIGDVLTTDDDLVWVPSSNVSAIQSIRAGDIAICMSSGSASVVGKTAFAKTDWPGSVGAFCALLRADPNQCLPEYLGFYLKSPKFRRWTSEAQGANIKNIRKSALEDFAIPLPPHPEQHRIVDILSRAEGIVRLRREAQQKAAELMPGIFLDMFGDPATNPKGWPVATIGDVIESADYGSSKKSSEDGSGLPLIRMGNVGYDGSLRLANLKHVELPPNEVEKYRLREGDILFNRTNSRELVGKTGLWDGSCGAVVASYFIRMRVERKTLNPFYLWAFMNSSHMKRVLFDTARGAIGQANINSKELKAFPIGVPPLDRQDDFERRSRDVGGIQSQQSAATAKAKATFDALLAQVFATTA